MAPEAEDAQWFSIDHAVTLAWDVKRPIYARLADEWRQRIGALAA